MFIYFLYNNYFTQRAQKIYAEKRKWLTLSYLSVLRFSQRTLRELHQIIRFEYFKPPFFRLTSSKKYFILISFTILLNGLSAQDLQYVRSVVDTLTSPEMHGRGYVNNGDKIAADFIRNEFENSGLKSVNGQYFQTFPISINTFPGPIELKIDEKKLEPGKDFVLYASSPEVHGEFELVWLEMDSLGGYTIDKNSDSANLRSKVIVTDVNHKAFDHQNLHPAGIIFLQDEKVWWHVSNGKTIKDHFRLQILTDQIPKSSKTIYLDVKNKYFEDYQTQNIIGSVEGKIYPDKYLVFSAHYDHLGRMGSETYFPGANDNASGTAMLLDLARYYSKPENQPEYSIAFMAFSAEEVGLLGSSWYVSNSLFPLEQIEFLVNLDMVGSGSEGIKVVNGTVFNNEFKKLVKINTENEYIRKVSVRGEAANSDHYPFFAQGVPSFFIYTLGKECKEYHNIYDTPENVPFTEYEDVFRLLTDFVKTFKD